MKVLLATDGSAHSRAAVSRVRWLAELVPQMHVIVLYVLPSPITVDQIATAQTGLNYGPGIARKAESALASAVDELTGVLPAEQVEQRLMMGVPGDLITEVAQAENVELIVMGARGAGPVRALLLGSTSHRVLQLATCPVLIVR